MKPRHAILVFLICMLSPLCFALVKKAQPSSPGEQVSPPDSSRLERMRTPPADLFERQVVYMLRLSNRYALNTWYNDVKGFASQQGNYLDLGGIDEHAIRPVSHQAFALSLCLALDLYDTQISGVKRQVAKERTLQLIRSVAHAHKANTSNGWGDRQQSAGWAAHTAMAAWLMWEHLPRADREEVCRMMVREADRFLDYEVPHYRDRQGDILFPGDTKEKAWNSNILTIACCMLPTHPHRERWAAKSFELQISAYAAEDDPQRDTLADGVRLSEILHSSHIDSDGTAVNRHIVHPDYMAAIMHNVINRWICALAGEPGLDASLCNGNRIYRALTQLPFDGDPVYTPAAGGGASPVMHLPEGNERSEGRQEDYWLMDVMAHIYGWDERSEIKAIERGAARNRKMLEMLGRDTTGQYYQDLSENSFPSREEWFGAQVAFGYLGLKLHGTGACPACIRK